MCEYLPRIRGISGPTPARAVSSLRVELMAGERAVCWLNHKRPNEATSASNGEAMEATARRRETSYTFASLATIRVKTWRSDRRLDNVAADPRRWPTRRSQSHAGVPIATIAARPELH